MTKPQRIQLSRRRGFNLQEASRALNGLPAAKVDRATKWGNPFVVGRDGDRNSCVYLYGLLMAGYVCLTQKATPEEQEAAVKYIREHRHEIRGKNLACWCRGAPCHADILLPIVNAGGRRPKPLDFADVGVDVAAARSRR